jgi:hypothetical protein
MYKISRNLWSHKGNLCAASLFGSDQFSPNVLTTPNLLRVHILKMIFFLLKLQVGG